MTEVRLKGLRSPEVASPEIPKHEQMHINQGEYLKSAVYGGLDGVINILIIILAGIGANVSPHNIAIVGLGTLFGDAISMGLGDYLSSKSEMEFIAAEQKREEKEVIERLEDEKDEIREIYKRQGYSQEQANRISDLYATNTKAFVNIMMLQELGLVKADGSALINGLVTLLAFLIFGIMALIPYLITAGTDKEDTRHHTLASCLIGGSMLFSLGVSKSWFLGVQFLWKVVAGFQSLILGAAATAIGFGIGKGFNVV